jgi:hypothetical protein
LIIHAAIVRGGRGRRAPAAGFIEFVFHPHKTEVDTPDQRMSWPSFLMDLPKIAVDDGHNVCGRTEISNISWLHGISVPTQERESP